LTYAELANAQYRGIDLQRHFGNINSANPDLRKARDLGAKILNYHGWADQLIPPHGSISCFNRVSKVVGGVDETNAFNRLCMIPGMGHCAGVGSVGPKANENTVPTRKALAAFQRAHRSCRACRSTRRPR
jgi:Tannase and feruloyl esterase